VDIEPDWVNHLRTELDDLEPAQRVKVTGDWTLYITHVLLPELGRRRRVEAAEIIAQPDWDARRLAETIGSRARAMERIAKEGKKLRES